MVRTLYTLGLGHTAARLFLLPPPVPDGRLHVATEHGTLLDLILSTAENFPNSAPVQQYVCAFHALLLAEG